MTGHESTLRTIQDEGDVMVYTDWSLYISSERNLDPKTITRLKVEKTTMSLTLLKASE